MADHTDTAQSDPPQCFRRILGKLAIPSLLLASPSFGFVQKYIGKPGVVSLSLLTWIVLASLLYIAVIRSPWVRRNFRILSVLAVTALLAGYLLFHPYEDLRGPGKSSDRDEGLELAVKRMLNGQYPYYAKSDVAGPLSVLPGSILLATPFAVLGDVGLQNVFWLAAFLVASARWFRDGAMALCYLIVSLTLSPAAIYEWVSGGDLITNGIFVSLAILFTLRSYSDETIPVSRRVISLVFLGIALASRANYPLLLPIVGGALWRIAGPRTAFVACVIAGMTTLLLTLPFYLHDPGGFTPLLTKDKLAFTDPSLWWTRYAIPGCTLLCAMAGAIQLLRSRGEESIQSCLRWCAITTLTPLACMIVLSSALNGHADFSIFRDRFGLMYLFLAILGWGSIRSHPTALETSSAA